MSYRTVPEPTHCARCGEAYADHWGGCELVCPRDVPYADKHKYYPDECPALTGKPYTPDNDFSWHKRMIVRAEQRRQKEHTRSEVHSKLLAMNSEVQANCLYIMGIKHEREDIEVSTGKPYTPTYPLPWDVDLINPDEYMEISSR